MDISQTNIGKKTLGHKHSLTKNSHSACQKNMKTHRFSNQQFSAIDCSISYNENAIEYERWTEIYFKENMVYYRKQKKNTPYTRDDAITRLNLAQISYIHFRGNDERTLYSNRIHSKLGFLSFLVCRAEHKNGTERKKEKNMC